MNVISQTNLFIGSSPVIVGVANRIFDAIREIDQIDYSIDFLLIFDTEINETFVVKLVRHMRREKKLLVTIEYNLRQEIRRKRSTQDFDPEDVAKLISDSIVFALQSRTDILAGNEIQMIEKKLRDMVLSDVDESARLPSSRRKAKQGH